MLEQARKVYRSYGFAPIDTPALEYTEILLGKGGDESDKLIYRFKEDAAKGLANPAAKGWSVVYETPVPLVEFQVPAIYVPYHGAVGDPSASRHRDAFGALEAVRPFPAAPVREAASTGRAPPSS